jgi:ABC-type antimicrobial peptide transport system permease subunit
VVVGLPVALVSTRVLRTMLFEAGPVDPIALTAATALLSLVALAACYVPARRATHVDPVRALRAD